MLMEIYKFQLFDFVFLGNLESFEKIVENELSQQNLEIYKQVVKEYIEELIDMRKKNKQ